MQKAENHSFQNEMAMMVKKIICHCLIFGLVLLSASCGKSDSEVTTFILVRHAEKGNDGTDDPDLRPEGQSRARRLAYMLKDTPLSAIYSTNFKRTRDTVKPISERQKVDVQLYEVNRPEVIAGMVEKHRGGTVLITGHSNNIPWTANLLLGKNVYEDYEEDEYGIMLIVSVGKTNKGSSVTRLNF
ncbi:MAG TPA: phosphoglycerate mutase family protein [Chryseosolibacter sp.]|nr:phosphoglycerate mutase family protein [Chryseosolibacter sp.]